VTIATEKKSHPSHVHSFGERDFYGPLEQFRAKRNNNVLLKSYQNLPNYIPALRCFIDVLVFFEENSVFLFITIFSNPQKMFHFSTSDV